MAATQQTTAKNPDLTLYAPFGTHARGILNAGSACYNPRRPGDDEDCPPPYGESK